MVDLEVPEFSGLDNVAKTKALRRRELFDRKKIEKLDEAKRKTEEHEQKKLHARLEKEKVKESKKGTKRKASTACDDPLQVVSTRPLGSASRRRGWCMAVPLQREP